MAVFTSSGQNMGLHDCPSGEVPTCIVLVAAFVLIEIVFVWLVFKRVLVRSFNDVTLCNDALVGSSQRSDPHIVSHLGTHRARGAVSRQFNSTQFNSNHHRNNNLTVICRVLFSPGLFFTGIALGFMK